MEVCGSILSNSNYTEFHLKCIYCSTESELKDWEQFVSHIRNAHSLEDVEAGSIKIEYEYETTKTEDFIEEDPEQNTIDAMTESWLDDNTDYENNDYSENDFRSESPNEAVDFGSPISSGGSAETSEHTEEDLIEQETANRSMEEDISNSDDYEVDEDFSASESDEEIEENPPKRSKNNPKSLKRKLKVSFIRQNPRVLHFIQEFKKHSCLWNPNDPEFKNNVARSHANNSLIEAMDKKVNVLFTKSELKKTIAQLFEQYAIAAQQAQEKNLSEIAASYYNKCKFLSISHSEDDSKTDIIELNFKELNEPTTILIDTYERFPVLYDSSLSDFKSVEARTQAYIDISDMLTAKELRVNDTEVHLAILKLRKWVFMSLRRVKSKELRRACTKSELHYLQLCSFLPPKSEPFAFNCEICDKRFYIDYSLRAHMAKEHNIGELPYECSLCPRRFVKAHDMERHKLRSHCEKMLKCEYCDSTFSLKTDLTVHQRVHTGEKPFVCEICGKSFRLKLLLDYHINGCHLNLRPFECDLCPKKYGKRVQLKNHMKAHLNIKDKKCEICGAAFSCPTSLCRHRKTHYVTSKTETRD